MKAVPESQMLNAARSAIEGYDVASVVVARAQTWLNTRLTTFVTGMDVEGELQSAAEAGDDFPTGLGERICGVDIAIAARNHELSFLKNFLAGAKERLRGVIEEGADGGLEFLNDQLALVVEEVRAQEQGFKSLPSATEIVAAGDTKALQLHQHLQELTKRYAAIRTAQYYIVRAAQGSSTEDNGRRSFLLGGQVRDLVDTEKYFTDRRAAAWSERELYLGAALVPWRHATKSPVVNALEWMDPLPAERDSAAFAVLRICTAAKPWVPGMHVMREAVRLAEHAANSPARVGEAPHIEALLDLEELTKHTSPNTPEPVNPRPVGKQRNLANLSPMEQRAAMHRALDR